MSKLHIKKGDTVYVLSGDDRGQQGRVLKVEVVYTSTHPRGGGEWRMAG